MYQVSEDRREYAADMRPQVQGPGDAVKALEGVFPSGREAFVAIFLDTRHRAICDPYTVSVGTLNASIVHPRELFREALAAGAAAVIVAHNHPSGDPRPSRDDLELTKRLDKAGELLGVAVLDHLIVGDDCHISLREYGWPTGGAK